MAEAFGQLAWEVMRRNHARERLLLAVLRQSSLRRVLVRSNAIRLVSDNANGQVHAITQAHIKNRRTTTRPWKATGIQGRQRYRLAQESPPEYG